MSKWFPKAFVKYGLDVIKILLKQGKFDTCLVLDFTILGGKLDSYHHTLFNVALATSSKPNEAGIISFNKEIESLTSAQKSEIYRTAYVFNNPYVFEAAEVNVRSNQYSLNFLWYYSTQIDHKASVQAISNWRRDNPETPINLWFDGQLDSPDALEGIEKLLNSNLEDKAVKVRFRDVRELDLVKKNPKVFSTDIPFCFRKDLLRAITADYVLTKKETKYYVYSDFNVEPQIRKQLFDKRTLKFLDEYGFVISKGRGYLGFGNDFQILNGENSQLMKSHRQIVIDLNLGKKFTGDYTAAIYESFRPMLTHFLTLGASPTKKKRPDQFGSPIKALKKHREGIQVEGESYPVGKRRVSLKSSFPQKPVKTLG
jgi:hypothetical protein